MAPDHNPVFEAALEIARSREQLLCELRGALERDDEKQALQLARRMVGLGPGKAAQ
jgi:hypothetical protein